MQIKIRHYGEKSTNVQVVNPHTDEILANVGVADGQEITLTALTAHESGDIEVGAVTAAIEPEEGC